MAKDGAKSLTEPCLLSGISGDLILGITSKTVELSHTHAWTSLLESDCRTLLSCAPSTHSEGGTLERHHGTPAKSLHDHLAASQHSSPTIQQQHLPESMPRI